MEHLPGCTERNDPRQHLRIRPMRRIELDYALKMAAAEGWNPGRHDGPAFWAADKSGYLGAEVAGRVVGTISAVAYSDTYGIIGFFLMEPRYRRRGFGLLLWHAALDSLGERTSGGDSVLAMEDFYRRYGYRSFYRTRRCQGRGSGTIPRRVEMLAAVPRETVLAYDETVFGFPRPAFLKYWLNPREGAALAVREGNMLMGYGVIRRCHEGHKIGPLFARDAATAEDLFQGLAGTVPEQTFYLDVPEANPAAVRLAERHSLKTVFLTARMYNREPPPFPLEQVFGVTSLELG